MHKRYSTNSQGSLAVIVMIAVLVFAAALGAGYLVLKPKDKKVVSTTTKTTSVVVSDPADAATSSAPAESSVNNTKNSETTPLITETQLVLKVPGDEKKLPAVTPANFIPYMKIKLEAFECDFTQFPEGAYYVSKISANFIRGSFGCGGGAAITWYYEAGVWNELGYQDYVPCSYLVTHKIPSDFVSDCTDEAKPDAVLSNPNGPLK